MSSQLSLQQRSEVPPAPESHQEILDQTGERPSSPLVLVTSPEAEMLDGSTQELETKATVLPGTMARLLVARERIFEAARGGHRIRTYEVALDLDMSEFHFARQFRLAFDRSPHVYYDEVRAETARGMLADGMSEGVVARKIGFRRPAELRALLGKRPAGTLPAHLGGASAERL